MKSRHLPYYFIKPFFDYFFALALLVITFPFFLFCMVVVSISTKSNPFFLQKRVGKDLKVFNIIKFKTMKKEIPFDRNNPVVSKDNANVTAFGKFLRRTKLDELPQIINILKGDMSFIGPRPFVESYLQDYEPWEYTKFNMKPGLTGWAQVHGNGHLPLSNRSYYDIEYYNEYGPLIDLLILFKSVLIVIFGEDKFKKPVSNEKMADLKSIVYREEFAFIKPSTHWLDFEYRNVKYK